MASLSTATDGEFTEFKARLARAGLTAEMLREVNRHDGMAPLMVDALKRHPRCARIHSRFAQLADKIVLVKSWPGIDPQEVDAAVALATENRTIAGYEAEVDKNPLLDIVITVYKGSVHETLLYARDRMKEAHGDRYHEWEKAYAEGVDEKRVRLLAGAKPFTPNRIVIEVVDLGANWNRKNGITGRDVQKALSAQLAGFAVLYAASQSPEWVRQMDGEKSPYALAAALLLNVPDYDEWAYMPSVWHNGASAGLFGSHVGSRFRSSAFPVLREYKR